ncbi:MAG: DUF3048 domain-containing protein, partial [Acidimicrobiales bacterium]|nr:DUF3048 domain-containing protein [Acidimicrobiales bacterium]
LLGACGGGHPSSTTGGRCPLTDLNPPNGGVPARPALAVKVDNSPQARPQYGLAATDVVYEQPVEGGLTRLIAIYQCRDTGRIEPIRSARIADPDIVRQFGPHPLFAYAGGIDPSVAAVRSSPLIDVGTDRAPGAYRRDSGRSAPHNLTSSTHALFQAGRDHHASSTPPPPVFEFGPVSQGAQPAASVRIAYTASEVSWTWSSQDHAWLRSYAAGGATMGEGGQVRATNVVVMKVVLHASPYVEDATGAHQNLLMLTGTGPAQVFRNGSVVSGTWSRPALGQKTRYLDAGGRAIALSPGNTWVELVPTTVAVTVGQ